MPAKATKENNQEETPNFDVPKDMDVQAYIAQELEKAKKEIEDKQKKADMNKIAIGLTVLDKEAKEGSEKKNKDGQLMTDDFGQPLRYPTKYYVNFAFMGGSIKTEVKANQYQELQPTQKYFCKGYLGEVTEFGKSSIQPIFFEFESLS